MSYHKLKIHKHAINSPYKLQEEFLEYIDAISTGNKIMAVQELADIYGSLENEANKFKLNMNDLKVMSDLTKKVFKEGVRTSQDFISYLKQNHDSILSYGLGFIQIKCGDINYNFYHRNVQKFESASYPHNHQRDFVSEILKGTLKESVYTVIQGDNRAYVACGDINAPDMKLDFNLFSINNYVENDIYYRSNDTFHSVIGSHGTITKVTKYGDKINAYVIGEEESSKIQHIPEAACWRMVEEVFNYK